MGNITVRECRPEVALVTEGMIAHHSEGERSIVPLLNFLNRLERGSFELLDLERAHVDPEAHFDIAPTPARVALPRAARNGCQKPRLMGVAPKPGVRLVKFGRHATLHLIRTGRHR